MVPLVALLTEFVCDVIVNLNISADCYAIRPTIPQLNNQEEVR